MVGTGEREDFGKRAAVGRAQGSSSGRHRAQGAPTERAGVGTGEREGPGGRHRARRVSRAQGAPAERASAAGRAAL
ncbi:hypothetical protein D1643_09730, partial [Enterorhabdus sp. P55]|nr:hypothetical protein [Enterorhabdus sp. P55]